jgi:hypothetical protein
LNQAALYGDYTSDLIEREFFAFATTPAHGSPRVIGQQPEGEAAGILV